MIDKISERNEVSIEKTYDVIIIGGGIAGVSAALAAKRNGCSVLIIEKSVMLGGLATLGLITFYEPLCDGYGNKIIGGIGEELLHLSIKYGYDTLPKEWTDNNQHGPSSKRYATIFSPSIFVLALDELMESEGIDIMFDTVFSNTVMEGGICRAIIVENKSGRVGYLAKVFIDTTGDADVMSRSGVECVEMDNWLSYCASYTNLDFMKKAVEEDNIMYGVKCKLWGSDRQGRNINKEDPKYFGTKAEDITNFIINGRRQVREQFCVEKNQKQDLLMIPGMAQVRTTRRIKGKVELTEKDQFRHFDDSIGCVCDFSKKGPIYEIPYSSLLADGIKNIITAGRCMASEGHAWEVTRVIPAASLTGQAAGTAAAIAVKNHINIDGVPIIDLQRKLEETGVMIHFQPKI